MSINKSSQTLDRQLSNRIATLEQQMRDIKNHQPIGAGNLTTIGYPTSGALSINTTIASGAQLTFNMTATPAAGSTELTLWNFLHTIRIDVDDVNSDYPSGSTLTTAQKNLKMETWLDYDQSSDANNVRVYKVSIKNNDTASHVYYLRVRAYVPITATTTPGVGGA